MEIAKRKKTVLCDYIPISVAGEQKGYLWKYRDISDLKRAREKEAEIGFKIQGSLLLEALPEKNRRGQYLCSYNSLRAN